MKTTKLGLNKLNCGETAVVERLDAKGAIRRRLQDIGVIEGTRIECVNRSPLGDPCAFLIRGAIIALRSEDSSTIVVSR